MLKEQARYYEDLRFIEPGENNGNSIDKNNNNINNHRNDRYRNRNINRNHDNKNNGNRNRTDKTNRFNQKKNH